MQLSHRSMTLELLSPFIGCHYYCSNGTALICFGMAFLRVTPNVRYVGVGEPACCHDVRCAGVRESDADATGTQVALGAAQDFPASSDNMRRKKTQKHRKRS